jgi:hypothetical protein
VSGDELVAFDSGKTGGRFFSGLKAYRNGATLMLNFATGRRTFASGWTMPTDHSGGS